MKKKAFSLLFIAVISALLVLPVSGAQTDEEQQTALEIRTLINNYRAENGLYQYVFNSTVEAVAQKHTDYQVSIGESTHKGEGDSTSTERVVASGYGEGNVVFADEMIYNGQFATPQKAFDWWKNSEIHNAIMLSDKYHEIGVGVRITEDRIYYTVNVAMIQGVTAPGVGSTPVEPVEEVQDTPVPTEPQQATEAATAEPTAEVTAAASPVPESGEPIVPENAPEALPADYIAIPRLLLVVLVSVMLISAFATVVLTYQRLNQPRKRR